MKTFFRTIALITLGLLTLTALAFGLWVNQAKGDYETALNRAAINTPIVAQNTPPSSVTAETPNPIAVFAACTVTVVVGLSLLAVSGCLYFLPTIIARHRKHRNFLALFVLNLLALPSVGILWIVALIWALLKEQTPVVVQALPTPS